MSFLSGSVADGMLSAHPPSNFAHSHFKLWEQAQLPLFHDSNTKWDSAGINQEGKRQQGKNTDQQLLEEREETRHTIFVRTDRKLVPLS